MTRVEEYELMVRVAEKNLYLAKRGAKGMKTPMVAKLEWQLEKCKENVEKVKKGLI